MRAQGTGALVDEACMRGRRLWWGLCIAREHEVYEWHWEPQGRCQQAFEREQGPRMRTGKCAMIAASMWVTVTLPR